MATKSPIQASISGPAETACLAVRDSPPTSVAVISKNRVLGLIRPAILAMCCMMPETLFPVAVGSKVTCQSIAGHVLVAQECSTYIPADCATAPEANPAVSTRQPSICASSCFPPVRF